MNSCSAGQRDVYPACHELTDIKSQLNWILCRNWFAHYQKQNLWLTQLLQLTTGEKSRMEIWNKKNKPEWLNVSFHFEQSSFQAVIWRLVCCDQIGVGARAVNRMRKFNLTKLIAMNHLWSPWAINSLFVGVNNFISERSKKKLLFLPKHN